MQPCTSYNLFYFFTLKTKYLPLEFLSFNKGRKALLIFPESFGRLLLSMTLIFQ